METAVIENNEQQSVENAGKEDKEHQSFENAGIECNERQSVENADNVEDNEQYLVAYATNSNQLRVMKM